MARYYRPKVNKWVTLAASIFLALSGGLSYLFSVWSPALKTAIPDLDQEHIEIIAATANLGGYSSFISGFVYDALEHRHHVGPRLSLLLGCCTSFSGFFGIWLIITKRITVQWYVIAAFAALAANGGTWFDTCALATNLGNLPAQRGPVVGIIKAGVGLSSSLYTAAYIGAFQPHIDNFILFLAIVPASVGLICLPMVNYVPYVQKSEIEGGYRVLSPDGRFLFALQSIGCLALYLMTMALASAFGVASPQAEGVMALGVVVMLLPVLGIPLGSGGLFAKKASMMVRVPTDLVLLGDNDGGIGGGGGGGSEDENDGDDESIRAPLLESAAPETTSPTAVEQREQNNMTTTMMPSYSVSECFKLTNFWLMALICGCGVGCGLGFLNNSAQLVASLAGPAESRSVIISLFGVASCAGRLLFGALPEKALHAYGIPRPAFLALAAFLTSVAVGLLPLVKTVAIALYVLSFTVGLAFGAHWALLPSLSSELFGLDSFASIYTLLQLAPAACGYGFGALLIGFLYQETGKKHGDPAGTCVGADCFKLSFIIMAASAGVAFVLACVLTTRTLKLYRFEANALHDFDQESEIRAHRLADANDDSDDDDAV